MQRSRCHPVDGRGRHERDNALAESFNATLTRETLQGAARWDSAGDARQAVFRWVTRYDTRRRHSWCAQTSPADYETSHHTTTLEPAAYH